MSPALIRAAVVALLVLACTPTEPCACTPARTSLIVYGQVRTATGQPAPGVLLRYLLSPPASTSSGADACAVDSSITDADPDRDRTDAAGRFRTVIYSIFGPATRCLRVIAFANESTTSSDSTRGDGLLVPFRYPQPDSIGVVLTLP